MNELDRVRLVTPHPRYRESMLETMREFVAAGEENQVGASIDVSMDVSIDVLAADFEGFVERLIHNNANPAGTRVPQSPFWIVLGNEYAGRLNIRHELNETLRQFGGHIGYAVRPSMRRRGIATRALELGLVEARDLGLNRVLVTCSDDNIGSRKVIEANGGVLEDVVETVFHPEPVRRYWIKVPA